VIVNDFKTRVGSVEWGKFDRCHTGSVAANIVNLLSDDPMIKETHLRQLERNLLPQDVLCEAAYYAIPFLLELLQDERARGSVYEILPLLAICSQPEAYDARFAPDGEEQSLTRACRASLEAGVSYYVRDVQDRSLPNSCRLNALSTVCRLRDRKNDWFPAIRRAFDTESDPEMRQAIEEWLSEDVK
jgi:hypothetical protein